jgi:hypothetical protein
LINYNRNQRAMEPVVTLPEWRAEWKRIETVRRSKRTRFSKIEIIIIHPHRN